MGSRILRSCKSRRGCRQTNLYMDSSYCQWPYSWSFMCCNGTSFFHSHVSEKDKANSTRKMHDSSAASIKAYFHGLLIGAQDDLPMGAQVTGCLLNSFLIRELQEADLGYLMLGLTVKAGASLMLLSKQPRISASAIYICLRDLNGYTIYLDMLSDCKKLRELEIVDCGVTSLVVQNINETQHTRQRLPSLQLVTIRRLPSLKEVDFHTMGVNITSLSICDCPMVIDLTWIEGLINLEQLSVSDCNMVKKILSLDVANQETISLPKLKTIHLERLRELLAISDVTLKLESIVHVSVFLRGKLVGLLPVDKDKPKVLLDCDEIFSQTVMQDGNRSSYIMRVA